MKFSHFLSCIIALGTTLQAAADQQGFQLEETAQANIRVLYKGKPFTTYVTDQGNKPYLYPIYSADGAHLSRHYPMQKVEGEQYDHPHQRSLSFGHESIGGYDSWAEKITFEELRGNPKRAQMITDRLAKLGSIRHREYKQLIADQNHAKISAVCEYLDREGKIIATEERVLTFRVKDSQRSIDFHQEIIASEGDVTFADKKDAGLYIRVPSSMAVTEKKGGKIINSEGQEDEATWAQAAKWCAYSGPVGDKTYGIAIFNHPTSFRYPTTWHVRTYGLFTANPFASQEFDKSRPDLSFSLKANDKLVLRHRVLFYEGATEAAKLHAEFDRYANESF